MAAYTSLQVLKGSGWVLEPYNGDQSKTLVSYAMHVSVAAYLPSLSVHSLCLGANLALHVPAYI